MNRPWQQQTVIAPVDVADAARVDANRTAAGIPTDPDADGYVPDDEVPSVVLGEGVPLIDANDPDDAPVKARAWDLRVRDRWQGAFGKGVQRHGLTVYRRPEDVETMADVIEIEGYRRKPKGDTT